MLHPHDDSAIYLSPTSQLGSSIGAEDVDSLQQLVSSSRHRRIMVYPIQAGREALQEAPVCTLKIIWGAIHAAQMKPVVPHATGSGCFQDRQSKDDVLDVIGVLGECESSLPSCSQSGGLGEVSTDEVNPPTGIPNETESGGKRKSKTSSTPSERKREDASPKGRRAREFDARKERAAERKAKKERLKRQQELDRLKRAKKQQHEILEQQEECISMQEEDDRSTAVDRHIRLARQQPQEEWGARAMLSDASNSQCFLEVLLDWGSVHVVFVGAQSWRYVRFPLHPSAY